MSLTPPLHLNQRYKWQDPSPFSRHDKVLDAVLKSPQNPEFCVFRCSQRPPKMRLVALFFVLHFCLAVESLNASSTISLFYEKRGPHPFPLPDCPAGARLCDFFNGAYCYNTTAGDSCCEDGSGKFLFFVVSCTCADIAPGICSGGLQCGTGLAANRCCEVVRQKLQQEPQ